MARRPVRTAVSLVELVVVVMIIGVLVGVAAPRWANNHARSEIATTAQQLQTIGVAAELYYSENGVWPLDVVRSTCPSELAEGLRPNLFAIGPPIGGQYDWDYATGGNTAMVRVRTQTPDEINFPAWQAIDELIDDGVATTGSVTYNTVALWYIIEP